MVKRFDNRKKDREWSAAIRERDGACQVCGKRAHQGRLNAHHLVPRGFMKYRWNMDNGITLCVTCHTFGNWSAHKNPIWFAEWLHKNRLLKFRQVLERLRMRKYFEEHGEEWQAK